MAVKSHCRGWPTIFIDGNWVYADDLTPLDEKRPCARCGLPPTIEGYDACLGHIPGATSACCGHGVTTAFAKGRMMKELQELFIVICEELGVAKLVKRLAKLLAKG